MGGLGLHDALVDLPESRLCPGLGEAERVRRQMHFPADLFRGLRQNIEAPQDLPIAVAEPVQRLPRDSYPFLTEQSLLRTWVDGCRMIRLHRSVSALLAAANSLADVAGYMIPGYLLDVAQQTLRGVEPSGSNGVNSDDEDIVHDVIRILRAELSPNRESEGSGQGRIEFGFGSVVAGLDPFHQRDPIVRVGVRRPECRGRIRRRAWNSGLVAYPNRKRIEKMFRLIRVFRPVAAGELDAYLVPGFARHAVPDLAAQTASPTPQEQRGIHWNGAVHLKTSARRRDIFQNDRELPALILYLGVRNVFRPQGQPS